MPGLLCASLWCPAPPVSCAPFVRCLFCAHTHTPCAHDTPQPSFKGIFIKHLARMAGLDPAFSSTIGAYIALNAKSMLAYASCGDGLCVCTHPRPRAPPDSNARVRGREGGAAGRMSGLDVQRSALF
jgi:hypothetical protein